METETKLKLFIVTLLKACPYHEGGYRRKSKTTVLFPFPKSGQEHVLGANDD